MELQWDILLNDNTRFPRLLFFGDFSDERFRYGINDHLQYCLYFYFEVDSRNIPAEPLIRANLSLEEKIEENRPALVLTLLNDNAKNLFSDLIISIVSQVRTIAPASAKAGFIALCNEWSELFEPLSGQLSKADLLGIFAELSFLKYLLAESRLHYNDILTAWKGPFGKGHDFELGDHHFEVKGIAEFKAFAQISSEYQLDYLTGQELFLAVMEFGSDPAALMTLTELVAGIAATLRSATGINMNLFWAPLGKTGLNYSSLQEYDHHRFMVKNIAYYNCTHPDFPALKRSGITDTIRNIRYDLSLGSIQDFLINDITPYI
jgi:hypothetical protein